MLRQETSEMLGHMVGNRLVPPKVLMANPANERLHPVFNIGAERSRSLVWYTQSLFPRTVNVFLGTAIARQDLPAPYAAIVENQGLGRVAKTMGIVLMDSHLRGTP